MKIFSKRLLSTAALAALLITQSSMLYADGTEPHPGQSKEDERIESESHNVLGSTFKAIYDAIKSIHVYKDGTAKMSFFSTMANDTNPALRGLDLSVETQIGKAGVCDDRSDKALWLPLEFRVRAQLNGDQTISLKDVRQGLVRFVLGENTGLTFQILSYAYKKFDYDLGAQHTLEVTSATFKTSQDITGSVELVVKANIYLGAAMIAAQPAEVLGTLNRYGSNANPSDFNFAWGSTGSIGVRIKKSVLISVYGGYDHASSDNGDGYEGNLSEEDFNAGKLPSSLDKSFDLTRRKVGAGMHLQLNKRLSANVSFEQERYKESLTLHDRNFTIDGPFVHDYSDGTSETHYVVNPHASSTPGKVWDKNLSANTAMFNIEYRW